ncbi:MAG: RNA-binding S4 domain-containing protein [Clostridia bacterium]|nr:RNA-binding S4 domain-containing protein [Clostridia bacterium]
MRIDKFLKVSRILKRRSVAKEAGDGGRIKVNGRTVKPSYKLSVGDIVELGFNSGTMSFKVLELKDTVRKEQADSLYQIICE